jgi:hypothetical protein
MHKQLVRGSATASSHVAISAISLLLLALAYAAIDDITIDRATSFTVEYSLLVGCGAWVLVVAAVFTRARHYILAFLSLIALFAAAWGLRDIRSVVSRASPEFIAVAGAFLWFSTIAVVALWRESLALRLNRRGR